MTTKDALKSAVAHFGKRATVRAHPELSSPAKREKARVALAALGPKPEAPDMWDTARWPYDLPLGEFRDAVTEARDARKAWTEEHGRLAGELRFMRCAVGVVEGGLFNCIMGEGDTWEEALTKAGVALPLWAKPRKDRQTA